MTQYDTTRDGRVVETRRSSSAGWLVALLVVIAIVIAAFAFGFIDIDQTREGKAPTVKLETSGGEAPVFDIKTAKIDLGSKQESVAVPTVDVGTKQSTVTVPTLSVERTDNPAAKDK